MRWARKNPAAAVGLMIVACVLFAAAFAPWLTPYSATAVDMTARLVPPNAHHWMGTDNLGRDVFSRLLLGAMPSVQVGFGAVLIGAPTGAVIGVIAGFYRGSLLEDLLMRSVEILASIPILIWAIAIIGIIGVRPIDLGFVRIANETKLLFLLGILYVPGIARVAHAVAGAESKADYVKARRVQGAPDRAIIFSDVLPNCISPVVLQATILIASGILIEASLSFIGLGVQPPRPSWGSMLAESRTFILGGGWWLAIFPGVAISLTVIGLNLLGDALRDYLDPRAATSRSNVA